MPPLVPGDKVTIRLGDVVPADIALLEGNYLIFITLALVIILVLAGLEQHLPVMELVQFALILTVASIPVALPAVLSVTMAVGAIKLAELKAIVSRLGSIEELAGMDILCSDKTGTLTQNKLTLGEPVIFNHTDK